MEIVEFNRQRISQVASSQRLTPKSSERNRPQEVEFVNGNL
jgi:hypothetical protein